MNQEIIKQAAASYTDSIPQNEDRKKYSREDFKAGAEWRINSVWHDGNKEPQPKDEYLLVEYKDWGSDESNYDVVAVEEFKIYADRIYSDLIRWAYVSDLLPDRKEVQP